VGLIIDDDPTAPVVSASGQTIDLYSFVSMLLASSQAQARRIEALERELAALQRKRGSSRVRQR
jgi:hypothetical protein